LSTGRRASARRGLPPLCHGAIAGAPSRPRCAREGRQRSATQAAGARGCGLCLWIFACPDGGRRPPPGGLPYGLEHCGVIRGIREIRGHDQPVYGSPWRHPPCVPIVDLLPHFVGQVQPVQLRRHRALRQPEGRHVCLDGRHARDRRHPECSRVRALRTHAQPPLRTHDCPAVCPQVIVPLPDLHRSVAAAGRRVVVNRLCADRVVPMTSRSTAPSGHGPTRFRTV